MIGQIFLTIIDKLEQKTLANQAIIEEKNICQAVQDILKEEAPKIPKPITIEFIQKSVCRYFNLTSDQLWQNIRKREIVQARQIAMYFSKSLTKCSLAVIGSQIGGKDHATVLHACKTVNNLIDTDKEFRRQIREIERFFYCRLK